MTGIDWLAAIGVLLVIEGVLPFAAPAVWRVAFAGCWNSAMANCVSLALPRCWAAFFC
jgi:uncharacterized protein YjeT (DUF2065 family)